MARKPRTFEIGGFYHVVKRAVDGQKIFKNPQDSSRFIFGLEFFSDKEPINLWSVLGQIKKTRGVSDTPRDAARAEMVQYNDHDIIMQ